MSWLILLSLAKFCFYTGVLNFIGIAAMVRLFADSYYSQPENPLPGRYFRWLVVSLILSILGAVATVLLNAGMLMDNGLAGIADPLMLQIVWESSIGQQALARCAALLLMILCTAWAVARRSLIGSKALSGMMIVSIGVAGWSFTQSGHTAAAGGLEQILVALHVIVAGWWLGSFYPLITLCNLKEPATLKLTLHQYGKQAALLVSVLLLSGSALLLLLMNVTSEVNTNYLWVMGSKLLLVTIMLCFAAYHKWVLVRELATPADCLNVKRSIIREAVVGVGVLTVTATLTTNFSIAH